jgi:hypothetical protein
MTRGVLQDFITLLFQAHCVLMSYFDESTPERKKYPNTRHLVISSSRLLGVQSSLKEAQLENCNQL